MILPELPISSSQAAALRSFSQILGKPASECLAEAIADWINIVAPARVEEISQTDKPGTRIALCMRKTG